MVEVPLWIALAIAAIIGGTAFMLGKVHERDRDRPDMRERPGHCPPCTGECIAGDCPASHADDVWPSDHAWLRKRPAAGKRPPVDPSAGEI